MVFTSFNPRINHQIYSPFLTHPYWRISSRFIFKQDAELQIVIFAQKVVTDPFNITADLHRFPEEKKKSTCFQLALTG